MKTKTNLGGKREGAGRPKGEPTEPLNLRVPKRFKKQLVVLVKQELSKLLTKEAKGSAGKK